MSYGKEPFENEPDLGPCKFKSVEDAHNLRDIVLQACEEEKLDHLTFLQSHYKNIDFFLH